MKTGEVALKVAHVDTAREEFGARYRKLFFNEAKVAGMLHHPNIVTVYDAGTDDDAWYIVMENVPGGKTLHDHCIPDRLLPLEEVVRLSFQCARALDHAHRKGVVHRDIKPKNILLTPAFDVKIGDFSIALANTGESTTQVHGYIGSPLYMAPEQVREEGVTNRTDIFALGAVMYEMICGKSPFAGDNLPAIIHHITQRPHQPMSEIRSDIPPVLQHIIDRALRKNSGKRYATAIDLAADLSLVYDHLQLFEETVPSRDKYELVRRLKFFDAFDESEIWEVINAAVWHSYRPGDRIIAEGELDDAFFVIVSGKVAVQKGARTLDVLSDGDCFGEMGVIANKKRTATILAETDVTALKVRASLIDTTSIECQLRFHKVFLRTLVQRLSLTNEQVSGGANAAD